MESRERVLDAINHKPNSKMPIDFGGFICSLMHVSCIAELREYYGLEKKLYKYKIFLQ